MDGVRENEVELRPEGDTQAWHRAIDVRVILGHPDLW